MHSVLVPINDSLVLDGDAVDGLEIQLQHQVECEVPLICSFQNGIHILDLERPSIYPYLS